jgi:hypothetical protein
MRAMTRHSCLLLLACLTVACASERSDEPPRSAPVNEAPPSTKQTKPEAQPPIERPVAVPPVFEDSRVRVTDSPLPFALELGESGMSGHRGGNGDYLSLGGPPGGPLMLRIYPATVGADVGKLVGALQPDAKLIDGTVTLRGAERPAVTWITGESNSRTLWCGVIVAPADAAAGQPALLLELGVGHQGEGTECKTARDHHVLGPVLDSLTFG